MPVLSHALENLLYLDGRTRPDSPDRRALIDRIGHSRWLRFAVGVAPDAPMPDDDDDGLAVAAAEFSRDWQSWMGYRRAVIEVAPPGLDKVRFSLDRAAAAETAGPIAFPASTFAIITAWNPGGVERPNERANRRANERLAAHLDARLVERWPALNAPKSRFAEEGFAVLGLDLDEAWRLGEAFQQRAIYYVDRGKPLLVARRRGVMVTWEGTLRLA